jgi:hypothetical protein
MFLRLPLNQDRLLKVSALMVLIGLILPSSLRTISHQSDVEQLRRIELRPENEAPQLQSFSDLTNQQTYNQLTSFLNDRVAYRATVTRWRNNLRYYLLGEKRFNIIDVAPGGWLFFIPSYGNPQDWNPAWVNQSLLRLDQFLAWTKHQKAKLYTVIAPDKESVYPEKLSQLGQLVVQAYAPTINSFNQGYRQISQKNSQVIDFFSSLKQEKQTGGPLLYNPVGTHYTTRGAMLMVQSIISRIAPEAWNSKDVVRNGDDFNNELEVMLNIDPDPLLQQNSLSPKYVIQRPCVSTQIIYNNQTYKSYAEVKPMMQNFVYDPLQFKSQSTDLQRCPIIPGKTLIVGDSFVKGYLEAALGQYFEDVTFVHRTRYAPEAFQQAINQYDRVLLETVERDAPTVFNQFLTLPKSER